MIFRLFQFHRNRGRVSHCIAPGYFPEVFFNQFLRFSDVEIADTLGMAVGTVKSRLHRARAELRRRLGPYVEQ